MGTSVFQSFKADFNCFVLNIKHWTNETFFIFRTVDKGHKGPTTHILQQQMALIERLVTVTLLMTNCIFSIMHVKPPVRQIARKRSTWSAIVYIRERVHDFRHIVQYPIQIQLSLLYCHNLYVQHVQNEK